MKAVIVQEPGGPEAMQYVDVPQPSPSAGEAVIKIKASGVNFIDVYFRTGLYKSDKPIRLGMEAAGIVESVGPNVTEVKVGDSVAYAMARGSYAEYALVPSLQLIKVPEGIDLNLAASSMLQGMTAHYLTHSTFALKAGNTALVHAAAGGTGLLIVQIAKLLGARVYGTVSSREKAKAAAEAGCDEVILYSEQDFETEVKRLSPDGVHVVYDSVGAATFMKSLNCLRPRGMMVAFGQSSGAVQPIDPLVLSQKGSLFLTRPTLANYTSTRDELQRRAGDVLQWIAEGKLKIRIDRTYPLSEAAQAHRDLEGRKTSGKLLLIP
jgi:NADPH2:quinone reductase